MREWSLKNGDPLALTLACDTRLGESDYCNDHIWELSLGSGEPPALVLQTTFGLRARGFRIFPRFSLADLGLTDPGGFARQPLVKHLFPNHALLDFSPFPGIDVQASIWVPTPQSIACRYQITNRDPGQKSIRVEILGQLAPTNGQRMAPMEIQASQVLVGQTEDLAPLILVVGGSQFGSGSYPSLLHILELAQGETQYLTWIEAAQHTAEQSILLARQVAARHWDAEVARLELLNLGQVEIYSGDSDWDAALMLAQKCAYTLFHGATEKLPNPTIVYTRTPDQGYSMRGDGSDYNHQWSGQSPFEVYAMCGLLLPGYPQMVKGLLSNFLATQADDGSIDWKPGLAGQRSYITATPLLSVIAWRVYEITRDREFLEQVYPNLLRFIYSWFKSNRDRDGDGIPEWDHPIQAGHEDHPVYSRWQNWSNGQDIETAESPALCALLHTEASALLDIAAVLGQPEPANPLREIIEHLRLAIEISWDQEASIYRDVDRDTHFSSHSELVGRQSEPGVLILEREFVHPVRLLFHIISHDGANRRVRLVVHGLSASGLPRLEQLGEESFRWHLGRGTFTGTRVYKFLEKIEITGIEPGDQAIAYTAGYDHTDQSLLLPLWAGIPDAHRARSLIEKTITDPHKFWQPAGIPASLPLSSVPAQGENGSEYDPPLLVNLIWNTLVGEGLVRYGYRNLAAELVTRLMNSVIDCLKKEGGFRRYYDAKSGRGTGERDAIQGFAPFSLFMETLGVRILSTQRVFLAGFNPFPWPITVKYRGLTILRFKDRSTVIFPDGQLTEIDDPTPLLISID